MTPACAGTTAASSILRSRSTDDPRVRGDDLTVWRAIEAGAG